MANKRNATSDLNADNWNQEEEPEEAGTFKKAADDILNKRVVKTARRRLPQMDEDVRKNVFDSFTGFKTTPVSNSSSPFSFLAKLNTDSSSAGSATSLSFIPNKTPTTNGSTKILENGTGISVTPSSLNTNDVKMVKSVFTEKESTSPKKLSEYYAKLKGLNQSVAQWIKTHVDTNPVCILTPIFRDYEKYLKEIELKYAKEIKSPKIIDKKIEMKTDLKSDDNTQLLSQPEKKQDNFIFGGSSSTLMAEGTDSWKPENSVFGSSSMPNKSIFASSDKPDSKGSLSTTFNAPSEKNIFLNKTSTGENKEGEESPKTEEKTSSGSTFPHTTVNSTIFSFGQSSSTSTASAGFSFGGGKPFTFGLATTKSQENEANSADKEKEDDDDEPPKPDFEPVKESGSIYEQKCKVFVKKDGNYSDRGVGTLFLKPAPNKKMQLIVRAVNSLGNLLLNTLLTESMPIKRLNDTNIMLVCLPLPTSEPPPTATLLRVKTPEEANALFEALEKHKK